jgi:hypothetical protein
MYRTAGCMESIVGNGIENVDPVTGYNMNTVSLSALVAKGITSFDQDSTT